MAFWDHSEWHWGADLCLYNARQTLCWLSSSLTCPAPSAHSAPSLTCSGEIHASGSILLCRASGGEGMQRHLVLLGPLCSVEVLYSPLMLSHECRGFPLGRLRGVAVWEPLSEVSLYWYSRYPGIPEQQPAMSPPKRRGILR